MIALGLNKAKDNFTTMFENTVKKSEITEITSSYGSAILVDKNTWESINETLLLLNDKVSLKALLEGHENRKNLICTGKSIDEVFSEVQDNDTANC